VPKILLRTCARELMKPFLEFDEEVSISGHLKVNPLIPKCGKKLKIWSVRFCELINTL
jgi:hypothetical protein